MHEERCVLMVESVLTDDMEVNVVAAALAIHHMHGNLMSFLLLSFS